MGTFYETIPEATIRWILKQHMFWVATAPLGSNGHVNISPKGASDLKLKADAEDGHGTDKESPGSRRFFGLLDDRTFWYLDLTGSGSETISHLQEPGNGRMTVLFNAFEGPPKIVRLWGKGRVLENSTPAYDEFATAHRVNRILGARAIMILDIHQVGSSCGFSVPYFDFKNFRSALHEFQEKREQKFLAGDEKQSIDRYWAYKNAYSIDGLPSMRRALAVAKAETVAPIKKMVGPLAPPNRLSYHQGLPVAHMLAIALVSFLLGLIVALYGEHITEVVRAAFAHLDPGIVKHLVFFK